MVVEEPEVCSLKQVAAEHNNFVFVEVVVEAVVAAAAEIWDHC
jgi:hypothetical protein